jgi:GH15 family glucan-1,4-alpha-glucosidase
MIEGTSRTDSASYIRQDGYLPIGGYAAIGDGHTLALVGVDGSIDWMCVPELDAPSVFAEVLDPGRGGSFVLAPAVPFEARRRYLPRTNVLETTYETAEGSVRVTDAVTIDDALAAPWRELVRHVEGVAGQVPMRWHLEPRFDYGRETASFHTRAGALVARHGKLQLALAHWEAGEPDVRDDAVVGEFTAHEGTHATLVLLGANSETLPLPSRESVRRRLESTQHVWREWVSRHSYDGPYTDAVERSLLAIRLLCDGRTGAITAAGTTSLPEALHKKRNFDYRFAWVRDLSFTLEALMGVGMEQLSHLSIGWLLTATTHTHPRIDPVYKLDGSVLRSQESLSLSGYRGSQPVHLGNQAGTQLQLGGWGDLMETMWTYVRCGHLLRPDTGERLADMVDLLCALWRNQDAGLWELGDYADYMTSKLSCWTAFERMLDLAHRGQAPPRHVDRWQRERDEIERFIETRLYSEQRGSYLMKAGSDMLDCGVLLASRRGYGDPKGARMQGTIDAIKRELHAEGPLFYRYSGMREQENAFLACSFWMVEALAMAGRLDEAAELMDGAVALGNDLGLLSEEMEPGTRELRGNLPQALTHLALINAAAVLARQSG